MLTFRLLFSVVRKENHSLSMEFFLRWFANSGWVLQNFQKKIFALYVPSDTLTKFDNTRFFKKNEKFYESVFKINCKYKLLNYISVFQFPFFLMTQNNKVTSRKVLLEHIVPRSLHAKESKKFWVCWMLKLTFLPNYMVQFLHQGLSRQPSTSREIFIKSFLFSVLPNLDMQKSTKTLLVITDIGFQAHRFPKLP